MDVTDAPQDERDQEVLVVGAGFSRAVSRHMLLTDELGNEVRDRLERRQASRWLPGGAFENGYFEAWLSGLAEDQPDLGDADNAERRSLFTRSIGLTHEVISGCQRAALSSPTPDWLQRLLWLAHARRLTLISFNYDTIVESAVDSATILSWGASARVQGYDVLDHLPPRARTSRFGEIEHETFALLKLHGSIDWYWVPEDRSGATVRWAKGHRPPGLSPFLTPPTATKSTFYANPISRELWQRAGLALGGARRVALLGYSLPVTDLTVSGMLQRHLDLDAVEVVVVNREPEPVENRLRALGASKITAIGGDDAVARYVDRMERQTSQELLADLHARPPLDPDAPLVVRIDRTRGRIVKAIEPTDSGPVLRLAEHPSLMGLAGRAEAEPSSPMPGAALRDLLATEAPADATLRACQPGETPVTIIGHDLDVSGDVVRAHVLTLSSGVVVQ